MNLLAVFVKAISFYNTEKNIVYNNITIKLTKKFNPKKFYEIDLWCGR